MASYASSLETDPARLAAVSERRAALTALTRKYGETIDEVLAWAEDGRHAAARPRRTPTSGSRSCGPSATASARELGDAAATAHAAAPTAAADGSARAVTDELDLARDAARPVTVAVTQHEVPTPDEPGGPLLDRRPLAAAGAHGVDEVELLLAANTGAEPRPLHKGASGGELSRVMLALEVSLAGTSPVPTFVFDEVDAGVGGKAAVEVGRRLAAAGPHRPGARRHPPAAGRGVRRPARRRATSPATARSPRSGLTVLDDAERERELSRMLAGVEDSDTALAHARELLDAPRRAPSAARLARRAGSRLTRMARS